MSEPNSFTWEELLSTEIRALLMICVSLSSSLSVDLIFVTISSVSLILSATETNALLDSWDTFTIDSIVFFYRKWYSVYV